MLSQSIPLVWKCFLDLQVFALKLKRVLKALRFCNAFKNFLVTLVACLLDNC